MENKNTPITTPFRQTVLYELIMLALFSAAIAFSPAILAIIIKVLGYFDFVSSATLSGLGALIFAVIITLPIGVVIFFLGIIGMIQNKNNEK